MIEEALGQIPISLLASSLYATAAIGLTLNYLVLRYADFALGEYITVGCYVAALLTLNGLDPISAMLASGLAGATLAVTADELALKPLERRGATALQVFIATIGVSLLIRYVLSIAADLEDLLFLSSGFRVVPLLYFGNRPFTNLHLLAVTVLVASVSTLTYMSLRTKLGKGMRAVASNRDLAISSGIPVWRIRRFTRFLVGAFAGLSGALWAYYTSINPESGWRLLLWVFASSIIGNFTSFPLTLLGGFVIGFSENLGMWAVSRTLAVPTAYKPLIPYLAIVAVLLYRYRMRFRSVVEV